MSQRTVCDGCGTIIDGRRVCVEWGLGHSSTRVDLCTGAKADPRGGCAGKVLGAITGAAPGMRAVVQGSIERELGQSADAEVRERPFDLAACNAHNEARLLEDRLLGMTR